MCSYSIITVQCLAAVGSLATPSGDERVFKSAGETADDGTTSGELNLAAAVAVSGETNLPVLPLCTDLRTLSALRNTVISCIQHVTADSHHLHKQLSILMATFQVDLG